MIPASSAPDGPSLLFEEPRGYKHSARRSRKLKQPDRGPASIIFYSTGAPDSFHAFQPPAMDQTFV